MHFLIDGLMMDPAIAPVTGQVNGNGQETMLVHFSAPIVDSVLAGVFLGYDLLIVVLVAYVALFLKPTPGRGVVRDSDGKGQR